MAQISPSSRYTSAVLALTGIVVAYGIYLVYINPTLEPSNVNLRRSNAVHRPRRRLAIVVTPPGTNAPFGHLQIISRDGRFITRNLATQPLPSKEELQGAVGRVSESDMRLMKTLVVHTVLQLCQRARTPSQRDDISSLGLGGLPEALAAMNDEEVRRLGPKIALRLPSLDIADVAQAIERFLQDPAYAATGVSSSEDTAPAEIVETEDLEGIDGASREPSQSLKSLLYYIAEEDAKRKAYEHRGIHCDECGETPIRGVRWRCLNCPDYDLCSTCEAQTTHLKTHVLVKIKIPIPLLSQPTKAYPLWYPGDPSKSHALLIPSVRKRLAQETGFDDPRIDALYDQFTCIANVSWSNDPLKLQTAIDRRAFDRALTSERWSSRFAPNAVFDRMFAFYDTDHNGRIGFGEFVSGVAYLRGPKRFATLRRALRGFDFDDDGLVSRKDFLRLLRAEHAIQKQVVNAMVEAREDEQTYSTMDVLRSSQPISSVFNQEEIPLGTEMPRDGKQMNQFGDMEPLQTTTTILDDRDIPPAAQSDERRTALGGTTPNEHLVSLVSRFEEVLYGSTEQQRSHSVNAGPPSAHTATTASTDPVGSAMRGDSYHDEGDSFGDSYHRDPLWQAVEDGFNEMLDPLFEAKEKESRDVDLSREERQHWRKEINMALAEREVFHEELMSAATVDPLIATALRSFNAIEPKRKPGQIDQPDQPTEPVFRGEIVPTDAESLTQKEAEIAQRPLEDLLASAGYSTLETTPETEQPHASGFETRGSTAFTSEEIRSSPQMTPAEGEAIDPTMPQHRADSSDQPWLAAQDREGRLDSTIPAAAEQEPPSRQRLEYLALLDDAEKEDTARGGPGRLTFAEIEAIVNADSARALRGLATNWLECASF